ncbi:MAG: response regulator [Euryarchaeota archaeon]|nr:response regulator [Euryarchaeota archaeon]MDE1836845.1 response regulator [Euryarchaeota archaeon]MDE1879724.1 response regulator [Euryarchaeota archaeon]MDE2046053.1 response regulator [Thermoplasmata archaeon]
MTDVLLIGGAEEAREVFRALLRLHHFRVKGEASGAKEAKNLLKGGFKGVMLLDTELSDGDWGDVISKAQGSKPKVPVVLVSPLYGAEFEEKAKRLGACALLPRPFEIPELLAAIDRAMSGE